MSCHGSGTKIDASSTPLGLQRLHQRPVQQEDKETNEGSSPEKLEGSSEHFPTGSSSSCTAGWERWSCRAPGHASRSWRGPGRQEFESAHTQHSQKNSQMCALDLSTVKSFSFIREDNVSVT